MWAACPPWAAEEGGDPAAPWSPPPPLRLPGNHRPAPVIDRTLQGRGPETSSLSHALAVSPLPAAPRPPDSVSNRLSTRHLSWDVPQPPGGQPSRSPDQNATSEGAPALPLVLKPGVHGGGRGSPRSLSSLHLPPPPPPVSHASPQAHPLLSSPMSPTLGRCHHPGPHGWNPVIAMASFLLLPQGPSFKMPQVLC